MNRQNILCILIYFLVIGFIFAYSKAMENRQNHFLSDIEKYIENGESTSSESSLELMQSIIDQIEKKGYRATPILLNIINEPNIPQRSLAVYVWAVGFTKDPNAINKLINISKDIPVDIVRWNALQSLGKIGGSKAGDYLLSLTQKTPELLKEEYQLEKFDILNLLAEMQYERALPEMEVILKRDYKQYYWQSIFCFGKMGDKSIPYLLDKIDSPDKNIRFNSINLLGQFLLVMEAKEPLIRKYWIETDNEIRMLILSSLERIIPDLAEMKSFFGDVTRKEKQEELKKYAQGTIESLELYKQEVNNFKAKKKYDKQAFEREYSIIYKSAGKLGNIDALGTYSTPEDESKLKELRRQILTRNSDECFYDYAEVNKIIMLNRLISKNADLHNSL